MERVSISRVLWSVAGFVFFGLACVGVALPLLPTTPFLLVAAFCFARSSRRTEAWFKRTRLYGDVLEGYVANRAMSVRQKLMVLVPVTALMAVGFAMMGRVPVGRAVLAVVWLAHVVYFGLVVRTDRADGSAAALAAEAEASREPEGEGACD